MWVKYVVDKNYIYIYIHLTMLCIFYINSGYSRSSKIPNLLELFHTLLVVQWPPTIGLPTATTSTFPWSVKKMWGVFSRRSSNSSSMPWVTIWNVNKRKNIQSEVCGQTFDWLVVYNSRLTEKMCYFWRVQQTGCPSRDSVAVKQLSGSTTWWLLLYLSLSASCSFIPRVWTLRHCRTSPSPSNRTSSWLWSARWGQERSVAGIHILTLSVFVFLWSVAGCKAAQIKVCFPGFFKNTGACWQSSLLSAILGELPYDSGTLKVRGQLTYAAQLPWVFPGTIRSNILFGKEMNHQKYERVLRACALKKVSCLSVCLSVHLSDLDFILAGCTLDCFCCLWIC